MRTGLGMGAEKLLRNKLAHSIAALVIVFGGATSVLAQSSSDDSPENRKIERLRLDKADFVTAINSLGQMTGLHFVFEHTDVPYGKISLQISGVTAETALKYICNSAGAFYRQDDNGVYVLSHEKPVDAKAATLPVANVKPESKSVVRAIKLRKADPRHVYEMLLGKVPQGWDPRGWESINLFKDTTSPYRKPGTYEGTGSVPARESRPLATVVGNSNIPTPKVGVESGSDIVLPGESAGQLGGGDAFGGGGGGLGQGGGGLGGGGLGGGGLGGGGLGQGGGIGGGQGGQQTQIQGGQGYVPEGIQDIVYDPTTNDIIVRGPEDAIRKLQDAVAIFDQAPKQVTVKVEFITTSSSLSTALGFDWLYQRGTISAGNTPGTFASAGEPIFLNFATGDITTRLRTQLLSGGGKTVNAPIIRTLNNEPANVFDSIQTNIEITQLVSNGNGQTITAPQIQQIQVQTGLSVAPRINGDGTVTMYLTPQIQDLGQVRSFPDGTQVPDILTQAINVVARVQSGQTIVLGGLTRKSDTTALSRFPILGDLPLIGQFFRATSHEQNSSELLIFVTPTIIEDDENGQGV